MPESTKPQDAQAALADVGRPPAGDGPGGGHRPDARDGPGDVDGRGGRARVPPRGGGAAGRRTGPASGRAGLAGFVSGTSAEVGAGRAAGSREVGQRSGVASLCPRARQRGGPVHTQRRRPGTRNPTGCGGPEVASAWLRGRPQASPGQAGDRGCRSSPRPASRSGSRSGRSGTSSYSRNPTTCRICRRRRSCSARRRSRPATTRASWPVTALRSWRTYWFWRSPVRSRRARPRRRPPSGSRS